MDVKEFGTKVKEFALRLFDKGEAAGFSNMEVYIERSDEFDVRIFTGEIDNYSVSSTLGLGFRGIYEGKMGYSYTEKLDEESIDMLLRNAKENSLVVDSDDLVEIQAASPSYPEVETFCESTDKVPADTKIELAKALEREALARDKKIAMVNYAIVATVLDQRHIINTKGVDLQFVRNGAFGYVSVVAREGKDVKNVGKHQLVADFAELDAAGLAALAADEAVSMLGASPVPSGTYPVVLRCDAAGALLGAFAPVFSAERAQKGLSLLADKLGDVVASEAVTLIDDPLLPFGPLSAPFDAEGVPSKTKNVIDKGRLSTFLHNTKTALKAGVESTGNAFRGSFKSPVDVAPTNMFFQRGAKSLDELVQTMGDGLIITDLQGLHSGVNNVSGDFSLGANGYLVSGGKIVRPVEQITIAGNFFEMLGDITEAADDLEFQMPGSNGCFGSPSLLVKKMSIAGK